MRGLIAIRGLAPSPALSFLLIDLHPWTSQRGVTRVTHAPQKKNPKRWSRAECLGGARPTPTGSNWPASWKSQLWCLDWQHWWVHSTGVDSLQKSLASKKSLAWSTRCYLVDETLENLGFKDEDHKVMSHKHKKMILAHLLTIVVSLTHCKI